MSTTPHYSATSPCRRTYHQRDGVLNLLIDFQIKNIFPHTITGHLPIFIFVVKPIDLSSSRCNSRYGETDEEWRFSVIIVLQPIRITMTHPVQTVDSREGTLPVKLLAVAIFLILVWGSAFTMIGVAVRTLSPEWLVAYRMIVGAVIVLIYAYLIGHNRHLRGLGH